MKDRPFRLGPPGVGLLASACRVGPFVLGVIALGLVAEGFRDPARLLAAGEKSGDPSRLSTSRRPTGSSDTLRLAGQWRGRLTVDEEGETTELIVDLDRVSGRWTGQFDLPSLGVEDYPVDVAISGRTVRLDLTAAQTEFVGALNPAGTALTGSVDSQDHRDSLVLHRVGEPRLSDEFLKLEALAEDTTRVELLSATGAELRLRFNVDRSHPRLLMLLSPT